MEYFSPLLSKLDTMIINVLRKFVDQEIMPVRHLIDDDKEHIIVNKLLRQINKLGFDGGTALVETYGQTDSRISQVTSAIIVEELSRGDVGIGILSAINGWALMPAYLAGNNAIMEFYKQVADCTAPVFASFAMTEPDSGCDIENISVLHGKTIKTTATRHGDSWVINGNKVFASNAGISALYCVVCQTDASKGDNGIALIYVPGDSEGLSFGRPENKAGLKSDRNAAIFLDNVRVPLCYRAGGDGRDVQLFLGNLAIGRVASAAAAVGCAQGAFEEVLKYTQKRSVAGKPISSHSIAAGILAEIATGIETARAYYLQTAYMLSNPEQYGPAHSERMICYASIAKNYATDMAISVTNKAMELMGSYGYVREYHLEKYWRDVKEIQLWLGGVQLGKFDIARGYYPYRQSVT